MLALGINQDLYGSGVALSDGKSLLYAANEERFSRIKNHGGLPHQSLAGLLTYTGVHPRDITDVCMTGILTPPLPLRLMPALHDRFGRMQHERSIGPVRYLADFLIHQTPFSSPKPGAGMERFALKVLPGIIRSSLPDGMRGARIHITGHHEAHARCAYFLSGFEKALCVTADGMGDGLSLTVSDCDGERVERLSWRGTGDSLGLFFEILTEAYGFVPGRDEGKLTGLAAHGDPSRVREPSPFAVRNGEVHYAGPHGLRGMRWLERDLLPRYGREDLAAWAQTILEKVILDTVGYWLDRTGHERLVLGGGIFANVKLNQRLHELKRVREIFVSPNMGDGGNPVGALAGAGLLERGRVRDVLLGDAFEANDIESELRASGLPHVRMQDTAAMIAEKLALGCCVARLDGRMEWGPRALGNRSILAPAKDAKVVERLNAQLRRSDFMPFAPAMLAEEAPRFLLDYESGLFAGEFMTTCFQCTAEMKQLFPAVVHVDNTARAQIVRADCNPGLHAILKAYAERTGAGVVLNTSFNIHEEPIVRTPAEAIASFRHAGLDCLALGDYLVTQPG